VWTERRARDHAVLAVAPGLAIMLTMLELNLLGDRLRDSTDPTIRSVS